MGFLKNDDIVRAHVIGAVDGNEGNWRIEVGGKTVTAYSAVPLRNDEWIYCQVERSGSRWLLHTISREVRTGNDGIRKKFDARV